MPHSFKQAIEFKALTFQLEQFSLPVLESKASLGLPTWVFQVIFLVIIRLPSWDSFDHSVQQTYRYFQYST